MADIDIKTPVDNQEGTTMKVQNWLVEIGDFIAKDAPVVEMETDKVTMEIEAPEDGYLSEILVGIGADVAPGVVIARLTQSAPKSGNAAPDSSSEAAAAEKPVTAQQTISAPQTIAAPPAKEIRLSPSVRRYITENNIDVNGLSGTGKDGRLTLKDVQFAPSSLVAKTVTAPNMTNAKAKPSANAISLIDQKIPHSSMRRAIADHMSSSVATAPHVTAVFEMDFTAIAAHRAAHKAQYAAQGVKLTYTAYFIQACCEAMQAVPEVNSQWHDDALEIFGDVNIGIGTSLGDKGLVVPVLGQAQSKSLLGIAKDLQVMTQKARENKLKPADVRGGTFTISNHGVSGSLVATPIIINQPQSAILGVGKLEKRVVVETVNGRDAMIIKPMAFVSLTIDHRVLDGHQTDAWLSRFVEVIENWPSAAAS